MQHQPRSQGERPRHRLAGGDQNALGRLAGGGPERQDPDPAGPAPQAGQHVVETVRAMDQGQAAFGLEQDERRVEPVGQARIGLVRGQGLREAVRRSARTLGQVRGVQHHPVETAARQGRRRLQDVAFEHLEAVGQPVQRGVGGCEPHQGVLDFQARDLDSGHPREQAERRRPDAAAEVQDTLAGTRRHGRGQQDRVDRRAVAAGRLAEPNPPAQQVVLGDALRVAFGV